MEPAPDGVVPVEGAPSPAPEPDTGDDTELDKALAAPPAADAPYTPNNLDLRSPRGQRIYNGYKEVRALEETLGYRPSTTEVAEWHQRMADTEAMEADWTSGNPADMANFLTQWGEKSPEGLQTLVGVLPQFLAQANPQGLQTLAQALPHVLAQNNPQGLYALAQTLPDVLAQASLQSGDHTLYQAVAIPVMARYEARLYERAEEETRAGHADLAATLRFMADGIHWDRTGENLAGQPAQQARADPRIDAERRALDAERQRLTQAQQQQQQYQALQQTAAQRQYAESAVRDVHAAVVARCEEALAPVKATLDADIFEIYRDRLLETINKQVARAGNEQYRRYGLAFERAVKAQSDEAKASLVSMYTAMASRAIQPLRAKFLEMAAKGVTSAATQAHAAAVRAALQVSPSGGGTAGAAPTTKTARLANESDFDYRTRVLDNL